MPSVLFVRCRQMPNSEDQDQTPHSWNLIRVFTWNVIAQKKEGRTFEHLRCERELHRHEAMLGVRGHDPPRNFFLKKMMQFGTFRCVLGPFVAFTLWYFWGQIKKKLDPLPKFSPRICTNHKIVKMGPPIRGNLCFCGTITSLLHCLLSDCSNKM